MVVLLFLAAGARAQSVFPATPVGQTNPLAEQTVTVTAQAAGTVATVKVLTLGQGGLDFAPGGGGFSCVTSVLTPGGATPSCTQSVTFVPSAPGLRLGAVVLLDSGGAVLGEALISGTGSGGLGVLIPGNMIPVAGTAYDYLGNINDGKPATSAVLDWPTSQVLDGAGNLYIADSRHNRIRMVCASASATSETIKGTYAKCTAPGVIVTIVGNGNPTYTGDNGPASAATLSNPSGLAMDGAGNLYIADTDNNVVRIVSAVTGDIKTIAGNSAGTVCGGATDAVGDGCAATQATFNQPIGVTLDPSGNLYIADTNDHRIRLVSVSTGDISTIAGNGTTDPSTGAGGYTGDGNKATLAELNFPYTVAFDPSGNMYIPDSGNNVVRKVAAIGGVITPSSIITTFAGTGSQNYTGDGAAASKATLNSPLGVAVDAAANVYIADSGNHAIRKVIASSGFITTLLDNLKGTYYYNSTFTTVSLDGPSGLYLDGDGNLYLADSNEHIVREIVGNYAALDYIPTPVRQYSQSAAKDQTVENDGNAALDVTGITHDANATIDDTGITDPCPTTGNLAVDTPCAIGAVFDPQVAADPLVANIYVPGNTQDGPPAVTAPNSPLDIQLIGNATAVNSTTVAVTGNPNPAGFGQPVTLTATVQTGSGTGNLTGTVTFYNGTTVIQSGVAVSPTTTSGTNSTATASIQTSTLPVGTNQITATYVVTNDPAHLGNTSPAYPENILEDTTTTLNSSINPSAVGQNVTFTATVAIKGGGGVTPDGTVTFYDGANALQSVNLTPTGSTGVASYSTSSLTQGVHSITAQYSGGIVNPDVQASNSNVVSQDVQAGTTVAVTNGSPNPSNYGQQVTFTAVVTPTGTGPATGSVKFYYGTTLIGTSSLVGSTNQTTVLYSNLPVGTDNITADYLGDSNNSPSTSTVPYQQVVNKTQTTTTVSATPQPNGIAGGSVTVTATVQIVAGTATLGGTVSFASNGTPLGTANVNPTTGIASITLTNVQPATYSIIATYSGDSNDDTSTSTPAYPYSVVQATTQTTVSFSPGSALVGQPVTFTAKVSGNGGTPTGQVTFEANGTPIGAPANLVGGTATLTYSGLATGTYTITAVYGGDNDDQGSNGNATAQLVVGTIPTTTSLASASTTGPPAQVVLVAAVLNSEQVSGGTTPTPTGTVTFKSGTTVIGSSMLDSNGVATLPLNLPAGTYTIIAYYGGDSTHTPSNSQPVTVSTTATNFNLSVTPGSVSMAAKQNYTVNVTLTSVGGFTDTIGLGCASLPANVSCHFSSFSVPLAANGTATAKLTIDTNNPLSGGSTAMNSHTGVSRTVLAGLCLPFSLFFGWVFWRFRRRNARFLTMILVLVLSAAALLATGCGGFSTSSTVPGTYVIQVTGTGTNSGVIHYQNVTLTIT